MWVVTYREGWFWRFKPPPRNSKGPPNHAKLSPIWKLLKIAEFKMPPPQDVQKKDGNILKLPPVSNCFTLAITNKLVFIINSLKVPKIKKVLLYEMKFLVPNYSCLQNPWLKGLLPPDPHSLCSLSSTEFVEPPPPNKIHGFTSACGVCFSIMYPMQVPVYWIQACFKISHRICEPRLCYVYAVSTCLVCFLYWLTWNLWLKNLSHISKMSCF